MPGAQVLGNFLAYHFMGSGSKLTIFTRVLGYAFAIKAISIGVAGQRSGHACHIGFNCNI